MLSSYLLHSGALFESLGNACTIRNNNSRSRAIDCRHKTFNSHPAVDSPSSFVQAATQLAASQALASTREFTRPHHIFDTNGSCCRYPPPLPPPRILKSILYNGSVPEGTCSKSRAWHCMRTASGTSTCFIRWKPCAHVCVLVKALSLRCCFWQDLVLRLPKHCWSSIFSFIVFICFRALSHECQLL